MARDSERRPLTDAEIEELREGMNAQRTEIREALAEDLGGSPEDYRVENAIGSPDDDTGEAVPDGGEE